MKPSWFFILLCAAICYAKDFHSHSVLFVSGKDFCRSLVYMSADPYELTIIVNTTDSRDLDFEFRTGKIFWHDRSEKKIYEGTINNDYKRSVIKDETMSLGGFAMDWVYNNIYWTDIKKHTVEVANVEGHIRKVLIKDGLQDPGAIVLDPKKGLMFWSESSKRRIRSAGMDGSAIKMLLTNEDITVNGLTLDVAHELIYWVDHEYNEIHWSDYNGKNPGQWGSAELLKPYSISIFEDYIFWSDHNTSGINRALALTGHETQHVKTDRRLVYGVQVLHKSKQPYSENYCKTDKKLKYCSHLCLPTPNSSSICTCMDNFTLLGNKLTCLKNETKPHRNIYIRFAHGYDIRKISLDTLEMTIAVKDLTNATGLDFNFHQGMMFWAEWKKNKVHEVQIFKAPIDKPYERLLLLTNNTAILHNVHSLAIDWIYNHIYWTNSIDGTLEVSDFEGNWRKILFKDQLASKWGIALNPLEGWMFWTDGSEKSIEKAGMDGSSRTTILHFDITEPRDLTLDLQEKRVYWTDVQRKEISSCDYNGKDRRKILEELHYGPCSITIFEDSLYFTTNEKIAVFTANKLNGSNLYPITPVYFPGAHPGGINIFHESKQPKGTNYCQTLNKLCSHLCLPGPRKEDNAQSVTCACPEGSRLQHGGLTCAKEILNLNCERHYIVKVEIHNSQSDENYGPCTGTIVSERWVVTAASCVISSGGASYVKVNPTIRLEKRSKLWDVMKIATHPKFEKTQNNTYKFDVALLKISQRIPQYKIHELNYGKLPGSIGFEKDVFNAPTTYCEDPKILRHSLPYICATAEAMPGKTVPEFCKGGPVLEDGYQIGLLSVTHEVDNHRLTIFQAKEYKDFFLRHIQNKHRQFSIARPYRGSPQGSPIVMVKIRH